MNCRPGDLAIVTAGRAAGMMVTCVELLSVGTRIEVVGANGGVGTVGMNGPTGIVGYVKVTPADRLWRLDRRIPFEFTADGSTIYADISQDDYLLPIRPHPDDVAQRNEVETA